MVDKKVLICVPTQEFGRRADFYDYINIMTKRSTDILAFAHERSPAKNRNRVIQGAIDHNCTHILFVDDDMVPEPDALERLREHDVDIVSGLYLTGVYPYQPLIFDFISADGALATFLEPDMPRLIPIQGAGLGFCLININVFHRMAKPYFRVGELDPEEWCDDIGFFYRAHRAGIKSFCDTTVKLGHFKTHIVRPVYQDGQWLTQLISGEKGSVATPQLIPNKVAK